jgi:hypothetical protein
MVRIKTFKPTSASILMRKENIVACLLKARIVKPAKTAVNREFKNNMARVRYVHWIKANFIHKKQTRPLVREDVTQGL